MSEVREFRLTDPLPTGTTVLEASAGTGKTYTIASLAARYVADGIPLERMLLVTFTRLATGELRERVRERLVAIERGLRAQLAGAAPAAGIENDEVVALLAAGDGALAVRRLGRAIAGFDGATIVTTHSFCQEMLESLGVAGQLEPDYRFVEDLSDLQGEVVDDLYVRRFRADPQPRLTPDETRAVVRAAVQDATAPLVEPDGEPALTRMRLARVARESSSAASVEPP